MDDVIVRMDSFGAGWNAKEQVLGIAADHGGFELKEYLLVRLRAAGYKVKDFGNTEYSIEDDYPEYIMSLAMSLGKGEIDKAIAICGSGVGAAIAANKIANVRACLIHEGFSAHQGVEDDNMNMICLGGRVIGQTYAWELVDIFLSARFSKAERHIRRLEKVSEMQNISEQHSIRHTI